MGSSEDMREAQAMRSQIEYFKEEIERRKLKNLPFDDLSQKVFSATTRLNQLLAGI